MTRTELANELLKKADRTVMTDLLKGKANSTSVEELRTLVLKLETGMAANAKDISIFKQVAGPITQFEDAVANEVGS